MESRRRSSKRWLKGRERISYQAFLEQLFIGKCSRKMNILETGSVICIQAQITTFHSLSKTRSCEDFNTNLVSAIGVILSHTP